MLKVENIRLEKCIEVANIRWKNDNEKLDIFGKVPHIYSRMNLG